MDLLIERVLIVELKAVDRFTEVHISQALSYLKATGHPLALLINFESRPSSDARCEAHRLEPTVHDEAGPTNAEKFHGETQ